MYCMRRRIKIPCPIGVTIRHQSQQNELKKLMDRLPTKEQLTLEMQLKTEAAYAKFYDIFKWYERFTGLSEVRKAQQKVLYAEEQFREVQNKRREVYNLLSDVQMKRTNIHEKLQLSKPGQPSHLKLIMEEHEIIGEESQLKKAFDDIEKLERELFTNLTTAVQLSHEQERFQSDKTKYWSIIGSILGTIIGIIGTSINNSQRLKEMKTILNDIKADTKRSTSYTSDMYKKLESLGSLSARAVSATFSGNTAEGLGLSNNNLETLKDIKSMLSDIKNETRKVANYSNEMVKKVTDAVTKSSKVTSIPFTATPQPNLEQDMELQSLVKIYMAACFGALGLLCLCCCR